MVFHCFSWFFMFLFHGFGAPRQIRFDPHTGDHGSGCFAAATAGAQLGVAAWSEWVSGDFLLVTLPKSGVEPKNGRFQCRKPGWVEEILKSSSHRGSSEPVWLPCCYSAACAGPGVSRRCWSARHSSPAFLFPGA